MVTFKFDPDRITVNEIMTIEESGKLSTTVRVLFRHVYNEQKDEYLPEEEGEELVRSLTATELTEALQALVEAAQGPDIDPKS